MANENVVHVPKPDAQMVIECAEQVMGWKRVARLNEELVGYLEYETTDGMIALVRIKPNVTVPDEWNPFTSDDHAFMLVNAILALPVDDGERTFDLEGGPGDWMAAFGEHSAYHAFSGPDSRRRAIVLASLKAVKVPRPGGEA